MRLMLIDWMMEVCDEFALTRETFHLSVAYTDLYLSRQYCSIEKLQLLGSAALLIACKIEEIVCPRVSHFAYATDHGFTNHQIIEMEAEISKSMGFQLFPPTLSYWMNYFMAKWDIYAKANPAGFIILMPMTNSGFQSATRSPIPLFKSENMEDYQRFRSMMQSIDLSLLDLNH